VVIADKKGIEPGAVRRRRSLDHPALPGAGPLRPGDYSTIAEIVRSTVSTVSKALKKLEALGLLRRYQRHAERGDYDSTLYELFPGWVLSKRTVPYCPNGQKGVLSNRTE
jgi:hypothetical protein